MKVRSPKYAPGEIGRKGEEIYRRLIRPSLEAENRGRLIGIDVDSEDFEIGDDVLEVTHRLLARRPDAWIAMLRVGGGPVDRIGSSALGEFRSSEVFYMACSVPR